MDPQDRQTVPDVKEGYGVFVSPVRWKPYKPEHVRRTGRKGRWQMMNEYGGWENCEKPHTILPAPPTGYTYD